jgi:hypothetical protein
MLPRNIGVQLSSDAAFYPKRTESQGAVGWIIALRFLQFQSVL